jgi:hypothetical protein
MIEKPKSPKAGKAKVPSESGQEIELLPDAWERFEKAVDRVAKSPPQPRTSKKDEKKPKPSQT